MIAVIEGPDGAGKTTLARELEKHHGFDYIHFGPPTRPPLEEYLLPMCTDAKLAIDRYHLGEEVYGPLYRGGSRLGVLSRWYVDMYLESRGAVLVLKTAGSATLAARCQKRGEDFIKLKDLEDIVAGFDLQFEASDIRWKMRNPNPDELALKCHHRQTLFRGLLGFPQYIGRRFPSLLLVGDEPGTPPTPGLPDIPFIPMPNSCGEYLWKALVGFPGFESLGCVNSKDTDLFKLYVTLGTPRTVALGNLAHDRLVAADVPHGVVPHPQYVKRFCHDQQAQYRAMFRRASNWEVATKFEVSP